MMVLRPLQSFFQEISRGRGVWSSSLASCAKNRAVQIPPPLPIMAYKDPLDQKKAARQHYLDNKEVYKSRRRAWGIRTRRRNRTYLDDLRKLGCSICGYNRCIAAIDFHHLNPASKDFDVANMVSNCKTIRAIDTEVAKCIRVCSNCHREIHDGLIAL